MDNHGNPMPVGDGWVVGPTGYWQIGSGAVDELGWGPSVDSAQLNAPVTIQQVGTGLGYVAVGAGVVTLGLLVAPETAAVVGITAFVDEVGFGSALLSAGLNATPENVANGAIDTVLFFGSGANIPGGYVQFLQAMHTIYELGNIGQPENTNGQVTPDGDQQSVTGDNQQLTTGDSQSGSDDQQSGSGDQQSSSGDQQSGSGDTQP
jgi:hypothetical protein